MDIKQLQDQIRNTYKILNDSEDAFCQNNKEINALADKKLITEKEQKQLKKFNRKIMLSIGL